MNIIFRCAGDGSPAPRGVRVQNCADNAAFCNVRRNQPAAIQVQFLANHPSQQVRVEVSARLGGSQRQIPFPIGQQADVCARIVNSARPTVPARCPLARGQNFVWTLGLGIPSQAPPGARVEVTLRARDNRRNEVFCLALRVRVTN